MWVEVCLHGGEYPFGVCCVVCVVCSVLRCAVVPRIDRRAYPIAAKSLLRLLPSGSDRVHRIPNSNGTLRSTLDTKRAED